MKTGFDWSTLRILVGDPDWAYFKTLRDMLLKRGVARVENVAGGARVLEELALSKYDLLIVESELKDMGGIELVRRLRNPDEGPDPELPIIMLAFEASKELLCQAVETGVDHFLVKPTSGRVLYGCIENLISRPPKRFVAEGYVGPDRRRMPSTAYSGPERRSSGGDGTDDERLRAEAG